MTQTKDSVCRPKTVIGIYGSRDVIRKAFTLNLVEDGENWMNMLKSRNQTSYTYNEETAREISNAVRQVYFPLFKQLRVKIETLD
jgi:nucleotidyltransferase substrate binding protein (TIGR01987 family)